MTQEEKSILLKDLCARLPYSVKVLYEGQIKEIQYIEPLYNELKLLDDSSNYTIGIKDIKPYLRTMSSMTEEEKVEYCDLQDKFLLSSQYPVTCGYDLFDWLDKNMFDYRGLIPQNLAIEITEENNPYKN